MPVNMGRALRLKVAMPERKLIGGTAQEQLWTAIRSLKSFTTSEAAYAASTDDLRISEATADVYIQHLHRAGYLTVMRNPTTRTDQWRLVPRMNTGPLPPMLMQVSLLFDRNLRQVQDGPHASEVLL